MYTADIVLEYYCFVQVCEQNTNLKAEVIQLRSSKKQLSSELGRLKHEEFVKSTFINEAEGIMEQLEGTLLETKSTLPFLKKHKVYVHTYYLLYVCI